MVLAVDTVDGAFALCSANISGVTLTGVWGSLKFGIVGILGVTTGEDFGGV